MKNFFAKFFRIIQYIFVSVIILAAFLVSVTSLLTPVLNRHLPDMERYASLLLHTPVSIHEVHISWNAYEPELAFIKVKILDKDTLKPKLQIAKVKINFSLFRSLFSWTPLPEQIIIDGVYLTFHQTLPDQMHIEGFNEFAITDNITGQSISENDIVKWIFLMPRLKLQNIDVLFRPLKGLEKSITVKKLVLENDGNHHQLNGLAIFHQATPTTLQGSLDWTGDVTDLAHATAHVYLQVEDVTLLDWIHEKVFYHFEIKQGEGSAKIWADWNNNQWQKIQSRFQFYNLVVFSSVSQQSQVFTRLIGNIGWKRDGNQQIFAGNNTLIDMPDHLWPITNFSVEMTPDLTGELKLTKADVSYLDLHDVEKIALISGLLSPDAQKTFLNVNPSGEVNNLHVELHGASNDAANISLAASFNKLSLNAWNKFPGVINLTGLLQWNGQQGAARINSHDAAIVINQAFLKPLTFAKLNAYMRMQKDTNGTWFFDAREVNASNADVEAHANMTLTVPTNESPLINLAGDFTLLKAEHVSNYLPLKIFEPGLTRWLQNAFLKGQVVSGKAIIQGHLSDFPFEGNKNGTFLISGNLKDIDFRYAPNWPQMNGVNGELTFAGSSMTAKINSGKILDVPISSVVGTIPYMGSHAHSILTVDGMIGTHFENAERFIQESPLKKTIGKTFSGMDLQGPMQLKLNLVVPLKTPEKTTVLGNVTMPDATMFLSQWNLNLTQLKGVFQFTEKGVEGKNLQGQLFNEPLTINLSTKEESPESHFVQADIQGQLSVQEMENWLKVPLTKTLNGRAAFQSELHLYSAEKQKPIEFILRSNLQGININLPDPFGKTAEQTKDFQLDIFAEQNQPLRAKMHYADVYTAAIVFQKEKEEIHLVSGEIRLGGEANWPSQSGMMLTGKIKELNWNTLQNYFSQKGSTNTDIFRGADISIGKANLFGQHWSDVRVEVSKAHNDWNINLNGANVSGQVSLDSSMKHLQAKFQRVYFDSMDEKQKEDHIDPKTLPAISFSGNDVRYGNKMLGNMTLETTPSSNGLVIKNLSLNSSLFNVQAEGDWQSTNNQYRSRLEGKITTTKVSDLLNAWGFNSSNFIANEGNFEFDLAWPDAPFGLSAKGLSGTFSVKIGKGRVINLGDSTNAKMDFARMLNLLSLQTLPRRLSLDFSDLFQQGYSFDYMKGNFQFKNGNAYTQNTKLDGPIAGIEIEGRIGLHAKDYDLKIGVTPYVTSSLPIVATIAGGPIAGVATWVVDKIVTGKMVAKVNTHQYTVTGTWSNPQWHEMGVQTQSVPTPAVQGKTNQ